MQIDPGSPAAARTWRRMALAAPISALAAVALLVASPFATAHRDRHGHPSLALVAQSPATVTGRGFVARRQVRVTLAAPASLTRRARASAAGGFTVTFPVRIDRCTAWTVTARQQHHAAVVLHGPRAECAPM